MIRYFALLSLLTLTCALAHGQDQYARYNGSCQQGGARVVTNGVQSSNKVQASFPACNVEVFNHGTLVHPVCGLWQDAAGTVPLANPFAASSTGEASFYSCNGRVDVQYSGGGIVTPFSVSDIQLCFNCTGGGGGTGSVTQVTSGNLSPLFTTSVTNPTTTPALSFSMTSTAPAHKFFGNNTGAPATPDFFSILTPDLPFTYSGNTLQLATVLGALIPNNCVKTDGSGNFVDAGTTCGGGGGSPPGAPVNTLQANVGSAFVATQDTNGNAKTGFTQSTGEIDPCNIDNQRYASCYNWTQSPSGSLSAGVPATVTLTPGPRGIDTTASATWPFYVYVAGTGTPEAVLVTGGTCTFAGSASCSITFTPANSHIAGFTIQSATAGHAEAALDSSGSNSGPMHINTRPAATTAGNNVNNSIFYAPWFVRCSYCVLDGNGGTWAVNNLRAAAVIPSVNSAHVTIQNVRFMPMLTTTHAAITQTSCTTNVATITSTLNPKVGEMVDVQFTNDPFYWGPHIVATTSAGSWTFAKTCTSIAAETTAGGNDYQMGIIEDNGSGTRMINLGLSFGGSPYDKTWNNGIVVLNDQAGMVIDGYVTEGHGSCNATYCGSAVYAPGDFVTNPAVLNIVNSNMSMSCVMNGVTAYNGNTVAIDNTIIQAYAMWAVNGGTQRGGFGGLKMTNSYNEIGSCTNPMYTPDQAVGVMWYGNTVSSFGGEVSQGQIPAFCTGGATTYQYYLVVHDSGGPSQSAPLYIGFGTPSGNNCTVRWPRAKDANTTTYDVIRTTDANNAPTTSVCTGGSTSACGSVVLGQAQCNGTLQCQFVDDVTVNTTAYTVLLPDFAGSGVGGATYSPTFTFFPSNFTLQNGALLNIQGSNVGESSIGTSGVMATNGIGPVVADSAATTIGRSYVRLQNLKSHQIGGTMLKIFDPTSSGTLANNVVGRIAILNPVKGTSGHGYGTGDYLLTLATPKSDEVIAANSPRSVTADLNDSGIALDTGGNNPALYSTGYTSPVGHSFYVGTFADGQSWKERLTSSLKEFAVPTQFDLPMLATIGCTDCGPFNRTNPFINDPLQTAPNLSGNWTTLLGTWTIGSGAAFPSGNYAYASALVSEGGINRAYAYYSGTSFTSDQIVQANMQPTNSVIGLCVRMQNAAPITAYCATSGGNAKSLVKYVAGVVTTLAGGGAPQFPNNAIIKLTAIGTVITLYINGVQTFQVTDTAISGGAPGLYAQNFAFSTQGIRNFYATSAGYTAAEGLTISSLAPKTLTDAATITWPLGGFSLQNATVTLGGARTLNITNPAAGGNYTLRIVQDGTGGRTLALGTGCTWKVVAGGGGTITLSAAAGAVDILTFYYDGANCYANLGLNYN